ncbi:MAG: methionyl-tRNA formyltransferase [Nitrospirae bacterium]|nr:methionyl-tRNA formyltransferase [Nitrospirota bacterium]
MKTTFIGNESPFLEVLKKNSDLRVIVCERVNNRTKKHFGSSYDYAKKNNVQIILPENYFSDPVAADLIIVSGYPKLIPPKVIAHPEIGIINIHQSLLPAYRGRHPLNWAIINGEKYTGITIHHINKKFDDGNIIWQEKESVEKDDTIMDVYNKTVIKGNKMLKKVLNMACTKSFNGIRQGSESASYYPPRSPKDGKIDWNDNAVKIKNLIRALTVPYPGAYFYYKRKKIIIDEAEVMGNCQNGYDAGEPFILNGAVIIKAGKGSLKILKIRNKNLDLHSLISGKKQLNPPPRERRR